MAPSPTSTRRNRLLIGLGTGAALVGSLAYIGIGDPHNPRFLFPACPFKALTGWNCPACGGLRMTHDLLHGDLAAAFVDNAFLLIGLPLLLVFVIVQRSRGKRVSSMPVLTVIVAAAVVWTVARNLPGFPLVPTVLSG
ncbi:DUF2752 domain-containing protein [Mycolicibacterium chlorophenolicum]|uniref:DUF2752 domain-containing protein n=1 Tax=Mycolicibacterium chlorophenolicum TaxID=37916 RepID=A0A0J6VF40_9MYCO|nr:DUF2752 domain-containing protein [Mycolicibacterium chlorophenolicum]KMO69630.1 hypothetical protein MCHLDSM_05969 [Mycolicibacterium chlorophenolicum]